MLRGKTMPKSDITTSTVADRYSPGSPPGALDPRNSEYENQRYGLLSHQAEPLPRFPSLSIAFLSFLTFKVWGCESWSDSGLVGKTVAWGKPWWKSRDSRWQQRSRNLHCQGRARCGAERRRPFEQGLNMFEQDVWTKCEFHMISRGSTILRCPLGTAGNALKTTLSESLGALDTLVPWQILAACCWNCFMSCQMSCLYDSLCLLLRMTGWPDDHFLAIHTPNASSASRSQIATSSSLVLEQARGLLRLVCFRSVVPNVKVMLRCLRKNYVFAMKKSPRIFQQTTGYCWGNEYLLDICTQTSNACVDVDMGRHVGLWLCVKLSTAPQVSWNILNLMWGCCCGYSPLIALGSATVRAQRSEDQNALNASPCFTSPSALVQLDPIGALCIVQLPHCVQVPTATIDGISATRPRTFQTFSGFIRFMCSTCFNVFNSFQLLHLKHDGLKWFKMV